MESKSEPLAITVAASSSPIWERLQQTIRGMGVSLTHVDRRQELAAALGRARTAPLLVYCGAEDSTAQDILDLLDSRCVRRPVLFLVDHSDFSQYYGLMSRGACDYFEVSDAPERIVHAIKRAAAGRIM